MAQLLIGKIHHVKLTCIQCAKFICSRLRRDDDDDDDDDPEEEDDDDDDDDDATQMTLLMLIWTLQL